MSKYKPLSQRLESHGADEWRASFAEIEEVLGFPLPKSAASQSWWMGIEKPHHAAWTAPGWRVVELDREGGSVLFGRAAPKGGKGKSGKSGKSAKPAKAAAPAPVSADAPLAAPAAEGGGSQPEVLRQAAEAASKDVKLRKMAMPAAIAGGAAAVLAGAAAVIAGFLAKRKGEPWR